MVTVKSVSKLFNLPSEFTSFETFRVASRDDVYDDNYGQIKHGEMKMLQTVIWSEITIYLFFLESSVTGRESQECDLSSTSDHTIPYLLEYADSNPSFLRNI
jgi:hypothetical protein